MRGIGFAAKVGFAAIIAGLPATAITLRADYRLDTAELGAALGLLGLGVMLSVVPWRTLAGRWGNRRTMTIGFAGAALALAAMMLLVVPAATHVPDFIALACGFLVIGLLGGCVNGAGGDAVWLCDGKRGCAMGMHQAAMPIGAGLGALVLPALAMRFGFAAAYGGLALMCAGVSALAWCWLRDAPATFADNPGAAATPTGLYLPLGYGVWRLLSAIGLLCAPQVVVLSFAAVFLHDFNHLGAATIGPILAAMQTGAAVARGVSSCLIDRRGKRDDFLTGCALANAALFMVLALLVWQATDTEAAPATTRCAIPLVLVAAGICASAWHGIAYAELATMAGAGRVGAAIALANTCVFAAFFVVPLAIPALLAWASWPSVWMAASFCAVIALLLFDKGMRFDEDVWG